MSSIHSDDTAVLRKARGAFFTPPAITRHIADWAIRSSADRILEPSAGDAEFMLAAVTRIRGLGGSDVSPVVDGVEIHDYSARVGRQRVLEAGGIPRIKTSDFFLVEPSTVYDAVIGNPPYIRYQDFAGEARVRSRAAALRAGVALTGLASSWAAFVVHSALFLKKGGRLGLVLPAELLSVNYAAPVRRFLFENFTSVNLVLFDEQVFAHAEADVVLLRADGFGQGPAEHVSFSQAQNAETLENLSPETLWTPLDPADKWTSSIVEPDAVEPLNTLRKRGAFTNLEAWGDTTLGIVTGNNKFFTLSPERAKELGLEGEELLPLSPPGSAHLRGLTLNAPLLARLGREGRSIYLFKPGREMSKAAREYVKSGENNGVNAAYKCRKRKVWYQVPILAPADLLLTCMNADTPRLTTNTARAHHLNSVHGVYLNKDLRALGRELLPIASLNSITLLNAEMVGRAYGGGILKIEPREADRWAMPSPVLVRQSGESLRALKPTVGRLLRAGRLLDAVALVDRAMLLSFASVSDAEIQLVRDAHRLLSHRRTVRGSSARAASR